MTQKVLGSPLAARSRVQSVDRAADLLRAVAEGGLDGRSTAALGAQCDLNRATAWRILSTLQSHGLVASAKSGRTWRLGPALLDLVRVAGVDAVLHDVRDVLRDVARHTGETAALAVLRDGSLTYIDESAPAALVAVSWLGQRVSLHATSTGKVVLAWSDPDDVARMIPGSLTRFTTSTITDRRSLARHLAQTRERGYATCTGEFDESAWGVSSPVLDPSGRLVAVVTIWGPPSRVSEGRFPELADITGEAATRIALLPVAKSGF